MSTMTAEQERYNGWKNYPTWAVHLWLTNDQDSDTYWHERAEEAKSNDFPVNSPEGTPRLYLADTLKSELEEAAESSLPTASLFTDLLGFSLDQVDWLEVADAFLES